MTLSQIEENLPNGFHDAEIERFVWNFDKDTAEFEISFSVGLPEGPNPEERRRGKVELQEIIFIAIDPPQPGSLDPKPYIARAESLMIDGILTSEEIFAPLARLRREIPVDTEVFSFYIVNWNAYIHMAAGQVTLSWDVG